MGKKKLKQKQQKHFILLSINVGRSFILNMCSERTISLDFSLLLSLISEFVLNIWGGFYEMSSSNLTNYNFFF